MTDLDELIILAATEMHEIARQAQRLGTGLQNVAPAQSAQANNSIQYLHAIADVLERSSKECLQLGPGHLRAPTDESQENG